MLLPYLFRRFSWGDVGYLGAIPLAAAVLLCHPGMHVERNYKTRATLDGLAIGTALLLLSWTLVLVSLWHHSDLTTAGGIVTVAYPFGDIVIITFFFVLKVRSTAATGRRPLFWVLLGLFAMAVSYSTYAYLTEAGRYSTGSPVDIGWVVAYLTIAVGASHDGGRTVLAPSHQASSEVSLVSLVTPYVPILLALVVITFQMELHHHVDRFAWLTGLGLTFLVIARQALLLNDRRRSSSIQPAMTGSTRRRRAPSPYQRISQRSGDLGRFHPGSGQEGIAGVLEIVLMPMSA